MKKNKNFLANKFLGYIITLIIFFLLGLFIYLSSSKINYVWNWNSIPKYFVYEENFDLLAPFDGTISLKENKIFVKDENKEFIVEGFNKDFILNVSDGEDIYENDVLAVKKTLKIGPILNGLIVTLKISFLAGILSLIIGTLTAFAKISSIAFLKNLAFIYIELIRGTPLIVQIFIFYFLIATIFGIDRFYAGAISLAVFYGAYIAEVLRGAIQSIDKGQYEASYSLGMDYNKTMMFIILPQALRRSLPALTGDMIALVKDSSLVSVISITDLTKAGREIVANTFAVFETWLLIALIYFMITSFLSLLAHKVEAKMNKKGGFS